MGVIKALRGGIWSLDYISILGGNIPKPYTFNKAKIENSLHQ